MLAVLRGIQIYTSSERCQVELGRTAYHRHIVFRKGEAKIGGKTGGGQIMRKDPGNVWKMKSID